MCAVCNEAKVSYKDGVYSAVGAPTEAALSVLAEKLGLPDPAAEEAAVSARREVGRRPLPALMCSLC